MNDLLAEIVANPDDDAPRLVYADTLVERGDPRGEFIQIQCELAAWKGEKTERYAALGARDNELFQAHRVEWQAPLRALGIVPHFERGFPHTLYLSLGQFFAARHLFDELPIQGLSFLSELRPGFAELVDAPELARLTHLGLSRHLPAAARLGDERFATLVRGANLSRLRELLAGGNDLDAHSCEALAGAAWFHRLTSLSLRDNPIGSSGVIQLAPRLGKLTMLDLRRTKLDDHALHALAATTSLRPASLSLSHARFTTEGIAALGRSGVLSEVDHLLLDSTHLGDAGVTTLVAFPMRKLEQLSLSDNELGDDAARAIAGSPDLGTVHWLDLRDNGIGSTGAAALAASTSLAAVRMLLLERNLLGPEGIAAFAAATGLPALETLGVTSNDVDDAAIAAQLPRWTIT